MVFNLGCSQGTMQLKNEKLSRFDFNIESNFKLDSITRKYSNTNEKLYEVTKHQYVSYDTIDGENIIQRKSLEWQKYICQIPQELKHLDEIFLTKMVTEGKSYYCSVEKQNKLWVWYSQAHVKEFSFTTKNMNFDINIEESLLETILNHILMWSMFLLFFLTPYFFYKTFRHWDDLNSSFFVCMKILSIISILIKIPGSEV